MHLILSGEMIDAREAYRIGLINEIVPADHLVARAEAILKSIAANAPIAVKFALDAVNRGLDTSQSEGSSARSSLLSALRRQRSDQKSAGRLFWRRRSMAEI